MEPNIFLPASTIDYRRVAAALGYYQKAGYRYVSVPWLVSSESIEATLPAGARPLATFAGELVGSGEQSLIELVRQGVLSPGKYVCVTPCFRDEGWHGESPLKVPYFLKIELMELIGDDPKSWYHLRMMADAWNCFQYLLQTENRAEKVIAVNTDIGHDLEINGVEIGSYGCRHKPLKLAGKNFSERVYWNYGTGLAEPRFTLALKET